MNSASQWRQEIARQMAPAYAKNPNVAAVVLGGSTARGHADRFSDIELGVFWHLPPADGERQAAIAQSGGDLLRLYPFDPDEQVWLDDLMMGRALPTIHRRCRSPLSIATPRSTISGVADVA